MPSLTQTIPLMPSQRIADPEYLRTQAQRMLTQAGTDKKVAWVTTIQLSGEWESALAVRLTRPDSPWTWEVGAAVKKGKGTPLEGGARVAISF
jgi:hypothetical protein